MKKFIAQAVSAVIMAGGMGAQILYQVSREENDAGRTRRTHTEEAKANAYLLAIVTLSYLSISWCAQFKWEKAKRKRIAFVARSALLAVLIPPLNFSDPEQAQFLQLVNLAHYVVSTFAAHTTAELPLDLYIS